MLRPHLLYMLVISCMFPVNVMLHRYQYTAHNKMDVRGSLNSKMRRNIAITAVLFVSILLLCLMFTSKRSEAYNQKTVRISNLLTASIHLAKLAGKQVVNVRQNKDPDIQSVVKGHTQEGAKEYVTLGDEKSNHLIVGGFLSKWPSLLLRSEETGVTYSPVKFPQINSEVAKVKKRDEEVYIEDITIWIDPLDATQEYTEGGEHPELLEYVMVMICIVVDGYPIAGVLHQPFVKSPDGNDGVTYWGWVDHGVSETLKHIEPSTQDNKLRIISSRSHAGNVNELIDMTNIDTERIVAAGSGYKSIHVSRNKSDVYLHATKIKKWDTCAGNAVINAMDGTMSTLTGNTIDYSYKSDPVILDGLIATTNSNTYKQLFNQLHRNTIQ